MDEQKLTPKQAAERAGVSPDTLRRWAQTGVIPEVDAGGDWTLAAAAHARLVARPREQGHSLQQIREAGRQGRLAYGFVEEFFRREGGPISIDEAADATGLEPALIERFWSGMGLPDRALERADDEDLEALQYMACVLAARFPLVASLQLIRRVSARE